MEVEGIALPEKSITVASTAQDVVTHIFVEDGATLTIEPGTVIRGEGESASGANDPGTNLRYDLRADQDLSLVVRAPEGAYHDVEVRAFFPGTAGHDEDPVTGSLNASLAQWLVGTGRVSPPYVASQGTAFRFSSR